MSHPMIMRATEGIILLKKAGISTGTHKLPKEEFPTLEIEVVCTHADVYTYTTASQNSLLQSPHFIAHFYPPGAATAPEHWATEEQLKYQAVVRYQTSPFSHRHISGFITKRRKVQMQGYPKSICHYFFYVQSLTQTSLLLSKWGAKRLY